MKMIVKFFILCGIAFYDAKIFCSEKKFGPIHPTRFVSHVVDDTTHFDYPELEQGFAIVGQDFQQFMNAKLVGKDFQDQMVADDESKSTALHDAITQAQQTIVDGCKSDVQKVLLDVADKKIDEDKIYNQKFNYVQRYKDFLQLDVCLYDWPVFKEGFDHLDEDEDGIKGFHECIKINMKTDQHYRVKEGDNQDPAWTSADFMFYDDGEIRLDFIYFILGAQSGIVDELQEKLAVPIKDTIQNGGDLHDVADSKMRYLLKYGDVGFIRKGLQKMFMGNGQELDSSDFIFNVLRTDNIKMFECLLKNKIIIADYQYKKGVTILGHSSQLGSAKIVKKIIGLGVDVNQPLLLLPLHAAVCNGQYEIVKILLDAGADVDLRDYYGRSAQDIAQDNKMKNIFTLFAAKKILKEIDHIETFREQERVLKLQKGFALLGRDYQAIMNEQLAGRHPDEPTFDEDGNENDRTALEESFLIIEEMLADDLHKHFMTTIAAAIENNSDIIFQDDSNLKYIYKYYDASFILQNVLSPSLYVDKSLVEGFDLLDLDVAEFLQEKLGDNAFIVDKHGILNQKFKSVIHEAEYKIVNEMKEPFLSALKICCFLNMSFDDEIDAKVRYLLDHKDIPFVARALKEFVNRSDSMPENWDLLRSAIYYKSEKCVKELLELGADASLSLGGKRPLVEALWEIRSDPANILKMHTIIQLLFDAGANMDEDCNGRYYSAWDIVLSNRFCLSHHNMILELFKKQCIKEMNQPENQARRRKNMLRALAFTGLAGGLIWGIQHNKLLGSSKK